MRYTLDDLHRLDPASIITYEDPAGRIHRPMTVVEIIMHICHGDFDRLPAPKPEQAAQ
jgi:hypothetical protein